MRISDNQIINSLKELKVSKLGDVKVGDVFNAKIVEVSDGKVIAEIKGKLVLLNNLIDFNLIEGETIELEVTSKEDGKIFTKPTQIEFSKELDIKTIVNELKLLDIEVVDKNIKIYDFLKGKNIQFSKQEIKELINNIKYVEKLINHIEKENFDFKKLDINNDLRKELIKIITNDNSSKINKEPVNSNEKLNVNLNKDNMIEELKIILKNNNQIENTKLPDHLVEENININENINGKEMKNNFVSELKSLELENIMFLVKEKFDINISKLLLSKNFFENGKSISNSLEKIIDIIEKSDSEILSKDIKLILNKFFGLNNLEKNDIEKAIKEIIVKISENGNYLGKDDIIRIKDEVIFIEKVSEFNGELNNKINYFQFSLQENSELRHAEIFIKKKNGNKKKDGFKIYLSLNTKKNGIVKSIVELDKRNLKIIFIAMNSMSKEKLEEKINEFRDIIESMNFNSVIIKFKINQTDNKMIELLHNEIPNKIDMKV